MVVENLAADEVEEYKMKTLNSTEDILVFEADVTQSFANAWRRAMIAEVPVMAVEEMEIMKNSSSMFDETLANRIGLLPLKTDAQSYNLPERCTCKGEGCAKCQVKLYLKAGKNGMIYADSITSKDPKIVPVHAKTPIVFLNPGHQVELELTASLGKGKNHAKYCPGLVYFKKKPKITIGKVEDVDAAVKACPHLVLKKDGNKLKVDESKLIDCDLCLACSEFDPNIKVETEDKYIFYIESWGQLDPKEIATLALDELEIKAKEFENALKELK